MSWFSGVRAAWAAAAVSVSLLTVACSTGSDSREGSDDAGPIFHFDSGTDAGTRPVFVMGLIVTPGSYDFHLAPDEAGETTFRAYELLSDGSMRDPADPIVWSAEPGTLGTIDEITGHYRTTSASSGEGVIVATAPASGLSANARFSVLRESTHYVGGAPADAATSFESLVTDASREAQLVYPLDGAMMPQDVYPANLQWERGASGDLFRIQIKKPHQSHTVYVRDGASPTHAWLVDGQVWRAIAQGDVSAPAEISVDRYVAASHQAVMGTPVHIRFAPGALRGSVYFWQTGGSGGGSIVQVVHGSGTPEPALPTEGGCVGCHSISHDGRQMIGRPNGSDAAGAFYDLSAAPGSRTRRAATANWYFSSWNPSSTRVITDTAAMALQLVDPDSGAAVPTTTLPTSRSAHPVWAPDGHAIAFVSDIDRNFRPGFDSFRDGDLSIMDVLPGDTFGAPVTLLRGATGDLRRCLNYPTWSPDSRSIIFASGDYSGTSFATSLYITQATPGATPIRLDKLSGGPRDDFRGLTPTAECPLPPTSQSCCENTFHGAWDAEGNYCSISATDTDGSPRFSPFYTGGYYWVVFASRRPYGNTLVGTARTGGLGTGRPQNVAQLWIAAINPSVELEDPSFTPYWLPGQDPHVSNIGAEWAPVACARDATECAVDADCCSGICSEHRCEPPPPERCRVRGELCGGGGCCGALVCTGNVCSDEVI